MQPVHAPDASRPMLGRYEVIAEIASGGMGTVYLARLGGIAGFQRLFAIKLLHRHLATEKHFVDMLLDEARLAARLHHPNAVGIVDVCESEVGFYLVMDYVDGFSMADLMDRARSDQERLRIGIRALIDGASGLEAAHRLRDDAGEPLGIVHRDVSPQNILVGKDGVGRITDFGVARAAARITASNPGTIKGKPCYMAPEQAQGQELDARADVFALGTVLWEVLADELLFESEGGPASVLLNVIQKPIDAPSTRGRGSTGDLDLVCLRALERGQGERTQTARAFVDELTQAAAAAGLLASQHEVADIMAEIFAGDLSEREEAIRGHVSAIEKLPARAMLASDVYQVPRLSSATPPPGYESGARATAGATPGSLSNRPYDVDVSVAPTMSFETPTSARPPAKFAAEAAEAIAHETTQPAEDAQAAATKRPVVWVALVILVGIALGAGLMKHLRNEAAADARTAEPTEVDALPVSASEPAPEATEPSTDATPPATDTPPAATDEASADEVAAEGAPVVEPTETMPPTEDVAEPEETPARRARRGARMRRPTISAPPVAPAPMMAPPAAPMGPTLEANPYL